MSLQDLPEITGRLAIQPFENRIEGGYGLVRTDTQPSVEVAVVHDGADRGIGEAVEYASLLSLSPTMLTLLREALSAWAMQFDGPNGASDADLHISGADLLEWFAGWRVRVRQEGRVPGGGVGGATAVELGRVVLRHATLTWDHHDDR